MYSDYQALPCQTEISIKFAQLSFIVHLLFLCIFSHLLFCNIVLSSIYGYSHVGGCCAQISWLPPNMASWEDLMRNTPERNEQPQTQTQEASRVEIQTSFHFSKGQLGFSKEAFPLYSHHAFITMLAPREPGCNNLHRPIIIPVRSSSARSSCYSSEDPTLSLNKRAKSVRELIQQVEAASGSPFRRASEGDLLARATTRRSRRSREARSSSSPSPSPTLRVASTVSTVSSLSSTRDPDSTSRLHSPASIIESVTTVYPEDVDQLDLDLTCTSSRYNTHCRRSFDSESDYATETCYSIDPPSPASAPSSPCELPDELDSRNWDRDL